MRNRVKILSLLLCLAMFLSMLGSCGKKQNNDADIEVEKIQEEINSQKTDTVGMDFDFTDRDNRDSYNENTAVKIELSEENAVISDKGAAFENGILKLTDEATYILSGKTSNCTVIVDSDDNSKIQIVLNNLEINNEKSPAIYIKNADKVFITLANESSNILSDGNDYSYIDGETNVDGVLFSKADLTFNGSGILTVNGNCKHGIVSKDDLVVTGGNYNITSIGVSFNGKDCVKISDGDFTLNAGSDGIRSDNEDDTDKGYVYISGGKFNIVSGNDGIQAQTVLKIDNGEFDIVSGGGSKNSSANDNGGFNNNWGFGGNDFGNRPQKPGKRDASVTGTSIITNNQTSSNESAKGIKSGKDILISDGVFKIDSADDSVHSNGTVEIKNGSFDISSGDDGMHGDTALSILNGKIFINKSYEGLESSDIVISGGNLTVISSDDGLNAAGGNDSSGMNGRPGMGGFTNSTGRIAISGGYNVIDASGDGIDANGSITVTGGVTIVYGPTNSGNGSLDYDSKALISGGTFIAIGSSGMAQGFSEAQNQGAIAVGISSGKAEDNIAVCDKDGNVIVCVTSKKAFSHIVVSSSGLQSGNKYTIVKGAEIKGADSNGYAENTTKNGGNEVVKINLTSNLYGSSGGMGGMGGMGGQRPPR